MPLQQHCGWISRCSLTFSGQHLCLSAASSSESPTSIGVPYLNDRLDQGRSRRRHDGDAAPFRRALCRAVPVAAGGHPACRQILPGQSFRNILDCLCLQHSVPPRSLRHQTLPITPSKRIITEYSGLRFRHNDVHLPLIVACCVTSC